ncbi:Acetyl esterase/lipase [Abditibacterium utsteinense]|uniref:Acetyl esterase/lipase n=1 Tax=Abditibacterium utsteinense TaxID=1960156 RepID=A0A2S8ST18_9BACT|nr:alpha/beta hydrolase [Abditibacterium utsteinense]PQV63937.1 Acetyl esterase/lipase [Abditibacterium utsteinense]
MIKFSPTRLLALTACSGTLFFAVAPSAHAMPKMKGKMMMGRVMNANGMMMPPLVGQPDPQMRAVLNAWLSLNPKPIVKLTPKQARQQPFVGEGVKLVLAKQGRSTAPEAVDSVTDMMVPGPAGAPNVLVRVYKPLNSRDAAMEGQLPVLVYFHGGGFVIASITAYDASCRALANKTGAVVCAVAYRMAPEHRLPAAHEDSYAATQYIMKNARKFGGNSAKVAVAGESAGGNLATDMCLMAKMRGGVMPIHQLLVYPVVQGKETASYRAYETPKPAKIKAIPLTSPAMRWFFKYALPYPAFGKTALASPLHAPDSMFKGLPPATIIGAQIDPLQSEGKLYAAKLRRNGIPVKYMLYPGVTHEFFGMGAVVDKAKQAENFAANQLKMAYNR